MKVMPQWISTPSSNATFNKRSCSCRMPGRERTLATETPGSYSLPNTSVYLVQAGESLRAHSVQVPVLQVRNLSPESHLTAVNLDHPALGWPSSPQPPPTGLSLGPGSSAPPGHHTVLTDVVQGACAEAPIELLGAECPKVVDGEGPEVEHVVARELGALFHQHHSGPQHRQLHSSPQTARSRTHHQALGTHKEA